MVGSLLPPHWPDTAPAGLTPLLHVLHVIEGVWEGGAEGLGEEGEGEEPRHRGEPPEDVEGQGGADGSLRVGHIAFHTLLQY